MRGVRFLCALLCVLMLLPLYGCGTDPVSVDVTLVENGEAKLYIQLPAETPQQILYAKDRLCFYVQKLTGVMPESGTEPVTGRPVLTLGNEIDEQSREQAEEIVDEELGNVFRIFAAEQKITAVAANDAFLYDAVDYLIGKMSYDEGTNTLKLQGVLDTTAAGDVTSLRYMFTQSTVVGSESVMQSTLPFHPGADGVLGTDDDVKGTQGGCIVGNYQYQCIIKTDKESNQMNNITYVAKYDLVAKETVMYSELLQLNHANDITYNKKTNELVIVHNAPRAKMLTFMDPETLQVTRTATLPVSVYAISYNETRDLYVVGVSGGQNLRTITADFEYAGKKTFYATETTKHYTTQGITSDDTFIYCVLYDSLHAGASNMQNVITVYDWYGKYVGTIHVDVDKLEPENISIVDGKITVLAYRPRKGGSLFDIKLTGPKAVESKK